MNWTQEQLDEYYRGRRANAPPEVTRREHQIEPRGHYVRGEMNKTEGAYAQELEARRTVGEILWWKYEAIKLRLADATFYTPDFDVMLANYILEFHEVKGGIWRDDARVKIKVAAELFKPSRFVAVTKRRISEGGGWKTEVFSKP